MARLKNNVCISFVQYARLLYCYHAWKTGTKPLRI
jgi:hypothetical protein